MDRLQVALELVGHARRAGILFRDDDTADPTTMARPGLLWTSGPDVVPFLQGQLTSDVAALKEGETQLSARVDRRSALVAVFSLHRLADESGTPRFVMLVERAAVARLAADLERYRIADEVTFEDRSDRFRWFIVQGPAAPRLVERIEPVLPEDSVIVAHGIGAHPGRFVGVPLAASGLDRVWARFVGEGEELGMIRADPAALVDAVEILRVEEGRYSTFRDGGGEAPLLPETGLENLVVSYTKGCYLGQEVIARARTYGSVRRSLRGLRPKVGPSLATAATDPEESESGGDEPHHPPPPADHLDLLERIPPAGTPVRVAGGTEVGTWGGRIWSPTCGGPLLLALLDRRHRKPGAVLSLALGDETVDAEVVLLPVYRSAGQRRAAPDLFREAIRRFADGDEEGALERLSRCLALDPGYADAYEAVGLILGRQERYHEAISFFSRLEEVAPAEPMVNTNLSVFYLKLGDKEAAETQAMLAARKSMAREGGGENVDPEVIARQQRQVEQAAARQRKGMFERVLAIDPRDPVALFGLGNALATLEVWEEAADCYARAREADPNNSAVHLALGKSLEKLGRLEDALRAYENGIDVAARRGDLMPLEEMRNRATLLRALARPD